MSIIPVSLIFLGGKAILKHASEMEDGVFGEICNFLVKVNDSMVYGDFKNVKKRREIRINGHLHNAYVAAIHKSIDSIKKDFKKQNNINKSLADWISSVPSNKNILSDVIDDICKKIIEVFNSTVNIENVFDNNSQISDSDQYFSELIELMVENGRVEDNRQEPYIAISKINSEAIHQFLDSMSQNLFKLFSENFIKELKKNGTAKDAYNIHLQHALFLKQSELEKNIIKEIKDIYKPPLSEFISKKDMSQMDYFHYKAENTDFVGRNDAIIHLNNFLNDNEKFRWLLITGEGGSGKSRLAHEMCKFAKDGGWSVGFFEYENDENYSFNKFSVEQNTLIVFDYIGSDDSFKAVCSAIKNLNQQASKIKLKIEQEGLSESQTDNLILPKIRFILLERSLLNHQTEKLNDQSYRLNFFPFTKNKLEDKSSFTSDDDNSENEIVAVKPFLLRKMNDEEKWELIHQVAGDKVNDYEKEEIMEQMATIDPLKRPLFIFIAAEAIKNTENIRGWDRNNALSWHIKRLKTKFWTNHFWNKDYSNSLNPELLNVIWLATVAEHINYDEFLIIYNSENSCISELPKKSLKRDLKSLFYSSQDSKDKIKFFGLTPDIVAEFFVINYLQTENGQDYKEELLNIAWTHFPQRTGLLLAKAARDFKKDIGYQYIRDYLFEKEFEELGNFFYIDAFENWTQKEYTECIRSADKAISLFEKGIERDDDFTYRIYAYTVRGISYNGLKNYEEALKNLDRAIELDNTYSDAYYWRWEARLNSELFEEASDDFKKYIEHNKNDSNYYINKGIKRFESGLVAKGWHNFNMAWIKKHNPELDKVSFLTELMASSKMEEFLTQVGQMIKDSSTSDKVKTKKLDFYPDHLLHECNIIENAEERFNLRILTNENLKVRMIMNGTSPPIHALNKELNLHLTAKNIESYLHFFCENVHGNLGAFHVINSVKDIHWNENSIEEKKKNDVVDLVSKTLEKQDNKINHINNVWSMNRVIQYGGALFQAVFNIQNNGIVEMLDDQPLSSYLPLESLSTVGCFYTYRKNDNILFNKSHLANKLSNYSSIWINSHKNQENEIAWVNEYTSIENNVNLITQLKKILQDENIEKIKSLQLDFYPGHDVYKIPYMAIEDEIYFIHAITNEDLAIISILNGLSAPIHELNNKIPIQLTLSNIEEYLHFFCENVHGNLGAFHLIRNLEDIVWEDNTNQSQKNELAEKIEEILDQTENKIHQVDNGWSLERLVKYDGEFFRATFNIQNDGLVKMSDGQPLAIKVPAKSLIAIGFFYVFKENRKQNNTEPTIASRLAQYNINWLKNNNPSESDLEWLQQFSMKERNNEILLRIDELLEESKTDSTNKNLDFYPGHNLYEMRNILRDYADYTVRIISNKYLSKIVILNGTSNPIHTLNKLIPIQLSAENIDSYLQFFCENVHGELGAFQIITNPRENFWNEEATDTAEKEIIINKISNHLEKLDNHIKQTNEGWTLERLVLYGRALSKVIFNVTNDGVIEMLDDQQLDPEIPINVWKVKGFFYYL